MPFRFHSFGCNISENHNNPLYIFICVCLCIGALSPVSLGFIVRSKLHQIWDPASQLEVNIDFRQKQQDGRVTEKDLESCLCVSWSFFLIFFFVCLGAQHLYIIDTGMSSKLT